MSTYEFDAFKNIQVYSSFNPFPLAWLSNFLNLDLSETLPDSSLKYCGSDSSLSQ